MSTYDKSTAGKLSQQLKIQGSTAAPTQDSMASPAAVSAANLSRTASDTVHLLWQRCPTLLANELMRIEKKQDGLPEVPRHEEAPPGFFNFVNQLGLS